MKLKIRLYIAFVCLVTFPLNSQNAASHCHVSDNAGDEVGQDYASRVNGLLIDIHATLQDISERAEAGAITAQEAKDAMCYTLGFVLTPSDNNLCCSRGL